ncbi:MAG: DUF3179 domain-containing (seleno)protein [Planctomycetota bacterium]
MAEAGVSASRPWEEGSQMAPSLCAESGIRPARGWVCLLVWFAVMPSATDVGNAAEAAAAKAGPASPDGSGPVAIPESVLSRFDREFAARDGYMRPLDDRGWMVRFRALRDFTRLGAQASSALAGALAPLDGGDTLDRRVLAARALSWTGDPGAEEALIGSLTKDTSLPVRLYAADALGVIRTADGRAALEHARDSDPNGDVRAHAGFALERKWRESWDEARRILLEFDDRRLDAARLGEEAPTFRLPSQDGAPVDLADLRGKSSVILIFIYGDTSPVCHRQLAQLRERHAEIEKLGAEVVVVDPHEPYRAAHMLRSAAGADGKASFSVLADSGGTVSGLYGVAVQMRIHGERSNRPATFVIDKDGILRFQHRATIFSDRRSMEKVLSVLRRIERLPAGPELSAEKREGGFPRDEVGASLRLSGLAELATQSPSGYTALTVFHPACPGCLTEAIALREKRESFSRLRVPVPGLSVAGPPQAIERFRKATRSEHPVDVAPWAADDFQVRFYPTLLIIDKEGMEVFRAAEGSEKPVDDALRFLEERIHPEGARAPQRESLEFSPIRVVKPFPPITDPPILGAAEAGDAARDGELVLGVVVSGSARAYPLNMLTGPQREIINDVIEGTAIAATW